MAVLDDIREQYPTLAFLVNDPEVGPLLRDAVDPNKGFSPETFRAKLYQTKWWTTRSTTQRNIDIMARTDPGEYKRLYSDYASQVKMLAQQAGMRLTSPQLKYIASVNLRNGVATNSPEFMMSLRNFAQKNYGIFGTKNSGSVTAAVMKVKDVARHEYYLPISREDNRKWAIDLAFGIKDEAALRKHLANRAASLYPHLRKQILEGNSMEDLFSGHRAIIAKELELPPDMVDFTRGWNKVLQQVDPQTGKPRMMTLHETQTAARQDKRWWSTTNGREADAGMANFMLKTFGKRA